MTDGYTCESEVAEVKKMATEIRTAIKIIPFKCVEIRM